jgi:hypothetical protein
MKAGKIPDINKNLTRTFNLIKVKSRRNTTRAMTTVSEKKRRGHA